MAIRRSKRIHPRPTRHHPAPTHRHLSRTAVTGLVRGAAGALGALAAGAVITWLRGQL